MIPAIIAAVKGIAGGIKAGKAAYGAAKAAKGAKAAQGAAKGAQAAKGATTGAQAVKAPTFKSNVSSALKSYVNSHFGEDSKAPEDRQAQLAPLPQYHKGGKVRKSGVAKLKKGEEVLTAKEAHQYHSMKKKKRITAVSAGTRIQKGTMGKAKAKGYKKAVLVK